MNSAKFSPRDLADLKHAWDFWLVSVDWQKCRGFSHSLDPKATFATGSFVSAIERAFMRHLMVIYLPRWAADTRTDSAWTRVRWKYRRRHGRLTSSICRSERWLRSAPPMLWNSTTSLPFRSQPC